MVALVGVIKCSLLNYRRPDSLASIRTEFDMSKKFSFVSSSDCSGKKQCSEISSLRKPEDIDAKSRSSGGFSFSLAQCSNHQDTSSDLLDLFLYKHVHSIALVL